MKFPREAPVTEAKKAALLARIERLGVDLDAIEEQFIKGGGPGGQKVNKTSSGVRLAYPAHSLTVKWTRGRSRSLNRFLALRELVDELEERVSPETSERVRARDKARRAKARRRRPRPVRPERATKRQLTARRSARRPRSCAATGTR